MASLFAIAPLLTGITLVCSGAALVESAIAHDTGLTAFMHRRERRDWWQSSFQVHVDIFKVLLGLKL
jgi:hypothetical protein